MISKASEMRDRHDTDRIDALYIVEALRPESRKVSRREGRGGEAGVQFITRGQWVAFESRKPWIARIDDMAVPDVRP